MVTNYPRPILHRDRLTVTHEAQPTEWIGWRIWTWIRQAICALQGHDELLQLGHERMSLKCVTCGNESNGWDLNEARPTVTVRGDARRHHLVRRQLIRVRRIA